MEQADVHGLAVFSLHLKPKTWPVVSALTSAAPHESPHCTTNQASTASTGLVGVLASSKIMSGSGGRANHCDGARATTKLTVETPVLVRVYVCVRESLKPQTVAFKV